MTTTLKKILQLRGEGHDKIVFCFVTWDSQQILHLGIHRIIFVFTLIMFVELQIASNKSIGGLYTQHIPDLVHM